MKQVAVGILQRNGLVLVCQRRKTALYPLQWEFPGGKVESGESPTDALIRELKEELGIVTKPTAEFHRQEWDYGDMAYRVFYYTVREFSGELENRAFETIRWVKPEALLRMNILEGNRDAVRMLCNAPSRDGAA
jgi:mutator protein MutT